MTSRDGVIAEVLRRIARGGDGPAVLDARGACALDELRDRVDATRRRLVAEGVGPGDRVGLLASRGRDETAGLLAVWAAGASVVPLERASPPERNRRILAACGARWGVGDDGEVRPAERLVGGAETGETVQIADTAQTVAAPVADRTTCEPAAPGTVLGSPVASDTAAPDEALVLHTSGSTGRPKGVPVTHAGVTAFVSWMCAEFGVRDGDRIAALAGPSFDLALFEQLAPLLRGGAVVRPDERCALSPKNLAAFLDVHRVAVVYTVPSMWTHLLRAAPWPGFASLRTVLFAGETFPAAGLRRLRDALPGRDFANLFGPTETNVCVFHRLRDGEPGDAPLPIGRATPYSDIAIVEPARGPHSLDGDDGTSRSDDAASANSWHGDTDIADGELCVRGPAVAAGYVGDVPAPERVTIAAHGPRPFLRTGDLVRRGDDGLLRFRGRRDAMWKLRGWRVEPGEIEAAVASHPGVEDALARLRPDAALGETIVCDVVLRASQATDAATLRRHAAALLPSWMVPLAFRVVDAVPRTERGKRDRRADVPGAPNPGARADLLHGPRTSADFSTGAAPRDAE